MKGHPQQKPSVYDYVLAKNKQKRVGNTEGIRSGLKKKN